MDHDTRIARLLEAGRTVRTAGFDDGPFDRDGDEPVALAGVICADTRFEGMVFAQVTNDGLDATKTVVELLADSKFLPQLHALVFDGVAFAGFNILDLPGLTTTLGLPVISVIRCHPDFNAIDRALSHLPDTARRRRLIERAGPVRKADDIFFQCHGISAETTRGLLEKITRCGHVPEPVRIAHLIASAVVTGESGRRA